MIEHYDDSTDTVIVNDNLQVKEKFYLKDVEVFVDEPNEKLCIVLPGSACTLETTSCAGKTIGFMGDQYCQEQDLDSTCDGLCRNTVACEGDVTSCGGGTRVYYQTGTKLKCYTDYDGLLDRLECNCKFNTPTYYNLEKLSGGKTVCWAKEEEGISCPPLVVKPPEYSYQVQNDEWWFQHESCEVLTDEMAVRLNDVLAKDMDHNNGDRRISSYKVSLDEFCRVHGFNGGGEVIGSLVYSPDNAVHRYSPTSGWYKDPNDTNGPKDIKCYK